MTPYSRTLHICFLFVLFCIAILVLFAEPTNALSTSGGGIHPVCAAWVTQINNATRSGNTGLAAQLKSKPPTCTESVQCGGKTSTANGVCQLDQKCKGISACGDTLSNTPTQIKDEGNTATQPTQTTSPTPLQNTTQNPLLNQDIQNALKPSSGAQPTDNTTQNQPTATKPSTGFSEPLSGVQLQPINNWTNLTPTTPPVKSPDLSNLPPSAETSPADNSSSFGAPTEEHKVLPGSPSSGFTNAFTNAWSSVKDFFTPTSENPSMYVSPNGSPAPLTWQQAEEFGAVPPPDTSSQNEADYKVSRMYDDFNETFASTPAYKTMQERDLTVQETSAAFNDAKTAYDTSKQDIEALQRQLDPLQTELQRAQREFDFFRDKNLTTGFDANGKPVLGYSSSDLAELNRLGAVYKAAYDAYKPVADQFGEKVTNFNNQVLPEYKSAAVQYQSALDAFNNAPDNERLDYQITKQVSTLGAELNSNQNQIDQLRAAAIDKYGSASLYRDVRSLTPEWQTIRAFEDRNTVLSQQISALQQQAIGIANNPSLATVILSQSSTDAEKGYAASLATQWAQAQNESRGPIEYFFTDPGQKLATIETQIRELSTPVEDRSNSTELALTAEKSSFEQFADSMRTKPIHPSIEGAITDGMANFIPNALGSASALAGSPFTTRQLDLLTMTPYESAKTTTLDVVNVVAFADTFTGGAFTGSIFRAANLGFRGIESAFTDTSLVFNRYGAQLAEDFSSAYGPLVGRDTSNLLPAPTPKIVDLAPTEFYRVSEQPYLPTNSPAAAARAPLADQNLYLVWRSDEGVSLGDRLTYTPQNNALTNVGALSGPAPAVIAEQTTGNSVIAGTEAAPSSLPSSGPLTITGRADQFSGLVDTSGARTGIEPLSNAPVSYNPSNISIADTNAYFTRGAAMNMQESFNALGISSDYLPTWARESLGISTPPPETIIAEAGLKPGTQIITEPPVVNTVTEPTMPPSSTIEPPTSTSRPVSSEGSPGTIFAEPFTVPPVEVIEPPVNVPARVNEPAATPVEPTAPVETPTVPETKPSIWERIFGAAPESKPVTPLSTTEVNAINSFNTALTRYSEPVNEKDPVIAGRIIAARAEDVTSTYISMRDAGLTQRSDGAIVRLGEEETVLAARVPLPIPGREPYVIIAPVASAGASAPAAVTVTTPSVGSAVSTAATPSGGGGYLPVRSDTLPDSWFVDPSWKTEPLIPVPTDILSYPRLNNPNVMVAPTTGRLVYVNPTTGIRSDITISSQRKEFTLSSFPFITSPSKTLASFNVRTVDDARLALQELSGTLAEHGNAGASVVTEPEVTTALSNLFTQPVKVAATLTAIIAAPAILSDNAAATPFTPATKSLLAEPASTIPNLKDAFLTPSSDCLVGGTICSRTIGQPFLILAQAPNGTVTDVTPPSTGFQNASPPQTQNALAGKSYKDLTGAELALANDKIQEEVVARLRALGYDVQIRIRPNAIYYKQVKSYEQPVGPKTGGVSHVTYTNGNFENDINVMNTLQKRPFAGVVNLAGYGAHIVVENCASGKCRIAITAPFREAVNNVSGDPKLHLATGGNLYNWNTLAIELAAPNEAAVSQSAANAVGDIFRTFGEVSGQPNFSQNVLPHYLINPKSPGEGAKGADATKAKPQDQSYVPKWNQSSAPVVTPLTPPKPVAPAPTPPAATPTPGPQPNSVTPQKPTNSSGSSIFSPEPTIPEIKTRGITSPTAQTNGAISVPQSVVRQPVPIYKLPKISIASVEKVPLDVAARRIIGEYHNACTGFGFSSKDCVTFALAINGGETSNFIVNAISSSNAFNFGQILPSTMKDLMSVEHIAPTLKANLSRIYNTKVETANDLLSLLQGNASDYGWRASAWATVAHFLLNNAGGTKTYSEIALRYNPNSWYPVGIMRGFNSLSVGGPPSSANSRYWVKTPEWEAVQAELFKYRADPVAYMSGEPTIATTPTPAPTYNKQNVSIVGDSIGFGVAGGVKNFDPATRKITYSYSTFPNSTAIGGARITRDGYIQGEFIPSVLTQLKSYPEGSSVIIVAGTNDYDQKIAETKKQVQQVIDYAKSKNITILKWLGASTGFKTASKNVALQNHNDAIQEVLKTANIPFYNLQDPSLKPYRSDVHYTGVGYEFLGNTVLKEVNLAAANTTPQPGVAAVPATAVGNTSVFAPVPIGPRTQGFVSPGAPPVAGLQPVIVDLKNAPYSRVALIPAGEIDWTQPIQVVTYFHGNQNAVNQVLFKTPLDYVLNSQLLAQQAKGLKNVVIIAPEFDTYVPASVTGQNASDEARRFITPAGFKNFLNEAAQAFGSRFGSSAADAVAKALANGNLTMVAYSGGYGPLSEILKKGFVPKNIVLLDAAYGDMSVYKTALTNNANLTLTSYYSGADASNIVKHNQELQQFKVANPAVGERITLVYQPGERHATFVETQNRFTTALQLTGTQTTQVATTQTPGAPVPSSQTLSPPVRAGFTPTLPAGSFVPTRPSAPTTAAPSNAPIPATQEFLQLAKPYLPENVGTKVASLVPIKNGVRLFDENQTSLGEILQVSQGAPQTQAEAQKWASVVQQVMPSTFQGVRLPFAIRNPNNVNEIITIYTKDAYVLHQSLVKAGLPDLSPVITRHYAWERTPRADGSLNYNALHVEAWKKLLAAAEPVNDGSGAYIFKDTTNLQALMASIRDAETGGRLSLHPNQNFIAPDALRTLILSGRLLGQNDMGLVLATTEYGHATHAQGFDVDIYAGPTSLASNQNWLVANMYNPVVGNSLAAQFAAYSQSAQLLGFKGNLRGGLYTSPSLHIGAVPGGTKLTASGWNFGTPFGVQIPAGKMLQSVAGANMSTVDWNKFVTIRDASIFKPATESGRQFVYLANNKTTGAFALNIPEKPVTPTVAEGKPSFEEYVAGLPAREEPRTPVPAGVGPSPQEAFSTAEADLLKKKLADLDTQISTAQARIDTENTTIATNQGKLKAIADGLTAVEVARKGILAAKTLADAAFAKKDYTALLDASYTGYNVSGLAYVTALKQFAELTENANLLKSAEVLDTQRIAIVKRLADAKKAYNFDSEGRPLTNDQKNVLNLYPYQNLGTQSDAVIDTVKKLASTASNASQTVISKLQAGVTTAQNTIKEMQTKLASLATQRSDTEIQIAATSRPQAPQTAFTSDNAARPPEPVVADNTSPVSAKPEPSATPPQGSTVEPTPETGTEIAQTSLINDAKNVVLYVVYRIGPFVGDVSARFTSIFKVPVNGPTVPPENSLQPKAVTEPNVKTETPEPQNQIGSSEKPPAPIATDVIEAPPGYQPFAVIPARFTGEALRASVTADMRLPLQTQENVSARVSALQPKQYDFIKDAPIFGYRITSPKLEDLPSVIRDHLGQVDEVKAKDYETYLQKNIGSVIALQMKNATTPDFYIISKDTFDKTYRLIDASMVHEKNLQLEDRLTNYEHMAPIMKSDDHLVGMIKTTPVLTMMKMSDLHYPIGREATIQTSFGTQTKPAGADAYIGFDDINKQFYMINEGDAGLPIGYVPLSSETRVNPGTQLQPSTYDSSAWTGISSAPTTKGPDIAAETPVPAGELTSVTSPTISTEPLAMNAELQPVSPKLTNLDPTIIGRKVTDVFPNIPKHIPFGYGPNGIFQDGIVAYKANSQPYYFTYDGTLLWVYDPHTLIPSGVTQTSMTQGIGLVGQIDAKGTIQPLTQGQFDTFTNAKQNIDTAINLFSNQKVADLKEIGLIATAAHKYDFVYGQKRVDAMAIADTILAPHGASTANVSMRFTNDWVRTYVGEPNESSVDLSKVSSDAIVANADKNIEYFKGLIAEKDPNMIQFADAFWKTVVAYSVWKDAVLSNDPRLPNAQFLPEPVTVKGTESLTTPTAPQTLVNTIDTPPAQGKSITLAEEPQMETPQITTTKPTFVEQVKGWFTSLFNSPKVPAEIPPHYEPTTPTQPTTEPPTLASLPENTGGVDMTGLNEGVGAIERAGGGGFPPDGGDNGPGGPVGPVNPPGGPRKIPSNEASPEWSKAWWGVPPAVAILGNMLNVSGSNNNNSNDNKKPVDESGTVSLSGKLAGGEASSQTAPPANSPATAPSTNKPATDVPPLSAFEPKPVKVEKITPTENDKTALGTVTPLAQNPNTPIPDQSTLSPKPITTEKVTAPPPQPNTTPPAITPPLPSRFTPSPGTTVTPPPDQSPSWYQNPFLRGATNGLGYGLGYLLGSQLKKPQTPPTQPTTPPAPTTVPPIAALVPLSKAVRAGSSATLSWSSAGTSICILRSGNSILVGTGGSDGVYTTAPLATTTPFSLTCTTQDGSSVTSSATVTVTR